MVPFEFTSTGSVKTKLSQLTLQNSAATNLKKRNSCLHTPCLASPQPQVSYPRAGPPPPSLIHMVELGFVGLLNNPKRIFAQLQKLEVKLAST